MITTNLGIGPLSPEIIEAVYRYSEQRQKQMMLIASLNQINAAGGYVCGWDTLAFKQHCVALSLQYPRADILLCRDHCGPFFMGEVGLDHSMDTVYDNLRADCEAGFDLIHIDMCHLPGSRDEILQATNRAIRFCLSIKPDMLFEVGTDAIGGVTDPQELETILGLLDFPIEFFVVNTGSLVREFKQAGTFDMDNTKLCTDLLHKHGIKAKEHNSDYLTPTEIQLRGKCGIDAMNVAPQLGVVQTMELIDLATDANHTYQALAPWMHEVYTAGKWKKWTDNADDETHCVFCAGHYHFSGKNYERLREVIGLSTEGLILAAMKVVDSYERNS